MKTAQQLEIDLQREYQRLFALLCHNGTEQSLLLTALISVYTKGQGDLLRHQTSTPAPSMREFIRSGFKHV